MSDRPNLLFIMCDQLRQDYLSCYGHRTLHTPNLDAFAAQGMRFNRMYTAAHQCAPSRTAIFAGRSPVGLGSTRFSQPAREAVPFFTDLLREHGYWVGLDGRHQHLNGRLRDLPHVTQELEALGMRGPVFEQRFDHFVGATSTKRANLEKVPATLHTALEKVPEGHAGAR